MTIGAISSPVKIIRRTRAEGVQFIQFARCSIHARSSNVKRIWMFPLRGEFSTSFIGSMCLCFGNLKFGRNMLWRAYSETEQPASSASDRSRSSSLEVMRILSTSVLFSRTLPPFRASDRGSPRDVAMRSCGTLGNRARRRERAANSEHFRCPVRFPSRVSRQGLTRRASEHQTAQAASAAGAF